MGCIRPSRVKTGLPDVLPKITEGRGGGGGGGGGRRTDASMISPEIQIERRGSHVGTTNNVS